MFDIFLEFRHIFAFEIQYPVIIHPSSLVTILPSVMFLRIDHFVKLYKLGSANERLPFINENYGDPLLP